MKAVVLSVTDEELAQRRLTGIDRFDEMWEGVLHMAPAPTLEHQRIVTELTVFLVSLCKARGLGTLVIGINVFNEAFQGEDYRIPDFSFVAKGR